MAIIGQTSVIISAGGVAKPVARRQHCDKLCSDRRAVHFIELAMAISD